MPSIVIILQTLAVNDLSTEMFHRNKRFVQMNNVHKTDFNTCKLKRLNLIIAALT